MGGKTATTSNASTSSGTGTSVSNNDFNNNYGASNSGYAINSTSLPQNFEAAYNQELYNAQKTAQSAFTPFAGGATNPELDAANSTLTGAAGVGSPYFAGAGQNIASSVTPAYTNVQNFMNPFQSGVINATLANMNQQNQQQQQGVIGNAIAQGAMGGDRVAVAQAQLAGQQALANNQTLAQLNENNYSQALAAAQGQQQQQLAAGNAQANLGSAATNSAVAAGLGALQGGENTYNNAYSQYQAQQAYPYQQQSWLSGIETGLGSNVGGTSVNNNASSSVGNSQGSQISGNTYSNSGASAGTQTQPVGNGISSAVGGVLGLGSLFASDRRVKEGVEPIGKTFDGQTVYRYNYKGDPRTQIGLIAQEVEKKHPGAVGNIIDGIKGVDYHDATEDAANRGHFAFGGGILPYSDGTIPSSSMANRSSIMPAQAAPVAAPPGSPPLMLPTPQGAQGAPGQQQQQQRPQQGDPMKQMLDTAKQVQQLGRQGGDALSRMAGNDGSVPIGSPLSGLDSSDLGGSFNEGLGGVGDSLGGEAGSFRRGGVVRGYDDGGLVGGDGAPFDPDSGIVGGDGQIFDPNIGWMPVADAANTANVGNAPTPGVIATPADTSTPDTFQQPSHPASSPHALMNPMAPWANMGDNGAPAAPAPTDTPTPGVVAPVDASQVPDVPTPSTDQTQSGGIIPTAAASTLPPGVVQPPLKNLTPEDAQKFADAGYTVPTTSVQGPIPIDQGNAPTPGVVPPMPAAQYIKPVPRPRPIQGENGPIRAPATVPASAPGSGGVVGPNVSPADAATAAQPSGGGGSVKEAVLARIASGEAKGFNQLYGGGTFNDYSQFPQWSGKMGPAGISHAAGLLQMQPATWAMEAKKLGLTDFSPQSQLAAGWDLAQTTYKQKTGRDLEADATNGNVQWNALGGQWSSLKGAASGPVGSASLPTSGGTIEHLGDSTDVTGSTGVVSPTGAPQQAGAAGQTSGSWLDSIRDHLGGRNLFTPEERMALMSAGFGMMGGTSVNPWVNIGQGAQQGIQTYRQGQQLGLERAKVGFEGQRVQQGAQALQNQAQQIKQTGQNLTSEIAQRNQQIQLQRYTRTPTPRGMLVIDNLNQEPPRIIPYGQMQTGQAGAPQGGIPIPGSGNAPMAPAPGPTSDDTTGPVSQRGMLAPPQTQPTQGQQPQAPVSSAAAPARQNYSFVPQVPDNIPMNSMQFTPEGQKVLGEQTGKVFEDARSDAKGANDANMQLEEMQHDLGTLPQKGMLAQGSGFGSRVAFAKSVNTAMQSMGFEPPLDEKAVAAGEDMNKLTTRLGFDLAKTIGPREAGFIVNQAVGAVPGGANSALGAQRIIGVIKAANQRKIDYNNFVQQWAQKTGGDTTGADTYFNQNAPPGLYALGSYVPARSLMDLKRNPTPEMISGFEQKYGAGAARFVLGQ